MIEIPQDKKKAACPGRCGVITTQKCSWCQKTFINGIEIDLKKDLPILYRGYKIDHSEYSGFQYVHQEYDGPEDRRIGNDKSIKECMDSIDEKEDECFKYDDGFTAWGDNQL